MKNVATQNRRCTYCNRIVATKTLDGIIVFSLHTPPGGGYCPGSEQAVAPQRDLPSTNRALKALRRRRDYLTERIERSEANGLPVASYDREERNATDLAIAALENQREGNERA